MDKKTIIGIVLMGAIFIGYVMYSSKQQAKYQEYMEQVQAEEMAKAEAEQATQVAEQTEAAIPADSTTLATAAEQAANREIATYGETLVAARHAEGATYTMSNDYLTVDFSSLGGMMTKVTLQE